MVLASTPFKTEFAVDMTCQSCVSAVKTALQDLEGIERYDIDLEKKRVTIQGRTPPSHLLSALKSTHRQVLVRGASAVDTGVPSQAAVSILESPVPLLTGTNTAGRALPGMNEDEFSQKVFGIARFVQVAPKSVLLDLTVRLPIDPAKKTANYTAYVSTSGNIIDPPATTGRPFVELGKLEPDEEGYADLFREVDGELWEWVGRACVVEASEKAQPQSPPSVPAQPQSKIGQIFAGVVARSAGAWGNDKTVCACSGRTMWEEGRDMEKRSML